MKLFITSYSWLNDDLKMLGVDVDKLPKHFHKYTPLLQQVMWTLTTNRYQWENHESCNWKADR